MRRLPSLMLCSTLLAAAASGCGDAAPSLASPQALALGVRSADLTPGMSVALTATRGGSPVSASELTWTSRDSSTVAVHDGIAVGRLPGEAYLIASDGDFQDSVHIVVHFPALAANDVGLRIGSGASAFTVTLKGETVAIQDYADTTYFTRIVGLSRAAGLHASGDNVATGDTLLWIRLSTRPALGQTMLPPFTVGTQHGVVLNGTTGAALEIFDSTRTRVYVAVKPSALDITSLAMSPIPSTSTGALLGHISFEAAGLSVDSKTNAVTPIGDQTVTVFAEFSTPVTHAASSVFRVGVSGTPFSGLVTTSGDAHLDSEGHVVLRAGGFQVTTAGGGSSTATASLVLPAQTGDYVTSAATAVPNVSMEFPQPAGAPAIVGTQKTGSVKITEYVAPTTTTWGVIGGSLAVTLEYVGSNPHPDYATLVTAPFRLAIAPTGQ